MYRLSFFSYEPLHHKQKLTLYVDHVTVTSDPSNFSDLNILYFVWEYFHQTSTAIH